ncbi:MAG: addiction module protein [Cyclobacteriaceae bacterium]|nr:addiction module protein [Cyclobacteriaceae bacterium]
MVDIKEIKKLSVEERIEMVEAIWDSIAEDTTSESLRISDEEKQMILKRFEKFKAGDQKTYSWDGVVTYAKEP